MEIEVVDLYIVDPCKSEERTAAFMHWIGVNSVRGEKSRVLALWDGGAQVSALDRKKFEEMKHRLGTVLPGTKVLRMADGTKVSSVAHWEGEVEVEGVRIVGRFEVFDSGGGWSFLFGKDLQAEIGAVHDMRRDVVTIEAGGRCAVLRNQ
ncbi:hypothetical protein R3P38DRAFT_2556832, partial [Favolaschia claudopus]